MEEINGKRVTPRLDFKEIINLNIRFMRAYGVYVPELRSWIGRSLFVVLVVLFVGAIFFGTLVSEIVNLIMVMGDLEKVIEASFITLTHIVEAIKIYYMYRYQKRIRSLVEAINTAEFQPKNLTQYASLKSYIRYSKMISKVFLSACVATCSFWGLYPFTLDTDLVLPLPGWFPFDTTRSPIFEIVYIYMIVSAAATGTCNISMDTFMSGLIYVGMLISEVVNLILVSKDMEKTINASFLALTHLVEICKVYAVTKHKDRLKQLLYSINRKQFQPKSLSQCEALGNYVQNSKVISKVFLSACVVTCAFWGVYPFVDDGKLQLPLPGWFPFETNDWPWFEFAYVYQVIGSTVNGLVNVSLDTFMSGLIYLVFLTSEAVNMILVLVSKDVEKTVNASLLTLTHLVEILKVYAVIKHNNRLKELLHSINRKEFQPKNLRQCQVLGNYVQNSKVISKMFLSACVATCAFWGVYPFVDDGKLQLPLPGWCPFDTNNSPWFEFAYVYQVVGSNVSGFVNITLDTFMSGLIMVVCAQLQILNDSLLNMRQYAEDELRDAGETVDRNMTKQLQEKMNEKLLECVIHHQCIIEFAKELTFLFTTSILGQFVVSVVIICITLFEITLVPVLSIKFLSMILYQFCMLLEIYLLCYYGNEVIRESAELTKSAFCSDWLDCSQEFKRNLLFFMTRSQVALKLYAGGFFTLSLETFVKILKSSWSYFAVLNSVQSEE